MQLHKILKQIRQQRHFNVEDVARYAGISPARLAEIESGQREPTFRQIEQLALTYGVPSYLFASEAAPNVEETPYDLRRKEPRPAKLSPAGMTKVWAAERTSAFTSQLAEGLKFKPKRFSSLYNRKLGARLAKETRQVFDEWSLPRQKKFGFTGPPEVSFFGSFRLFCEIQGTVVSVNDAPPDDFLGFHVSSSEQCSIAFINRKVSSKKAQLFTLLHEYAHSISNIDGVSDPFVTTNNSERLCNVFAANFLAPMDAFQSTVERFPRTVREDLDALVRRTSEATLLSRQAAAIRLYEAGYISKGHLRTWTRLNGRRPKQEKDEEKSTQSAGGNVHAKRVGEVGYLPVYLSKLARDKKIIDSHDVQLGIGLSEGLQTAAFALALRRLEAGLE